MNVNETNWRRCPACTLDPDPRGPSACFDCRELNRLRPPLDLSDAHVDRVARRLFRAFALHDFDVMTACEYDGRPVVDNWRTLAREAIQLGAVVEEGS
jgi:hypothetical protein